MKEVIERLEKELERLETQVQNTHRAIDALRRLDQNPTEGRPDNRPPKWQDYWAFIFPSRSGELYNHEVTMGQDKGFGTVVSCNCPAAKYGKQCWVAKGVSSAGRYGDLGDPNHLTIEGVKGERVHFVPGATNIIAGRYIDSERTDFGLVMDEA